MKQKNISLIMVYWSCLLVLLSLTAYGKRVYSVVPSLKVYELPSDSSSVLHYFRHGRWLKVKEEKGPWYKVHDLNGKTGYIKVENVTDKWLKIWKAERKIMLMEDRKVLLQFDIGLGFNPNDDKIKLGDGCTPEGRFYICEVIRKPKPAETYGPVSLRISYPNVEDARRGLKTGLITKTQYLDIVQAVEKGLMPPQTTKLGGSIKIHGGSGGSTSDWTLGCVALNDWHLNKIAAQLPQKSAMVEIYANRRLDLMTGGVAYVNNQILRNAETLIKKGCLYTTAATKIVPLKYPMGDLDPKQGVCTDVVIRALRGVNIDLQALLYEDIILHRNRYRSIGRPNPHIDHRRTRNLKIFFDHHAQILTNKPPATAPEQWQPGDIVLMDTGVDNGTIYDHIGIVAQSKGPDLRPLVINLWTIGCRLNEMDLLDGNYPKLVGHYRLHHPFYYDAPLR